MCADWALTLNAGNTRSWLVFKMIGSRVYRRHQMLLNSSRAATWAASRRQGPRVVRDYGEADTHAGQT
jgi:hypothetical protein